MGTILVLCNYCGRSFETLTKRINEYKKRGWKRYCSAECMKASRTKVVELKCNNPACGKMFMRIPSGINKTSNYCSSSCSATVNNRGRKRPQKTQCCANKNCSKRIPEGNKYCSNKCQGAVTRKSLDEHRADVISAVRKFYREHHRVPVRKEMYNLYEKARKGFGTWNNAIKAAGFEPNPVLFAKKYSANDGHKCDSLSEKIIDDWLSARKISHEIHVPYEGTSMTVDFKVGDVFIEFLGLAGEVREYDRLLKEKRKLWKKHGLDVIEVYPKDIFPKSHLDKVLKRLTTV